MKKVIKAYGNSAVVVLSKEDLKAYGLKIGGIINLEPKEKKKSHGMGGVTEAGQPTLRRNSEGEIVGYGGYDKEAAKSAIKYFLEKEKAQKKDVEEMKKFIENEEKENKK